MEDKIAAIAHHEAGHAVMCWHYRVPIRNITLGPVDDALGEVQHDNPEKGHHPSTPEGRRRVQIEASIAVAGPIAQELYDPDKFPVWERDQEFQAAGILLEDLYDTEKDWSSAFGQLTSDVKRLLAEPSMWRRISRLADALIARGKLSGDEALEIIDRD